RVSVVRDPGAGMPGAGTGVARGAGVHGSDVTDGALAEHSPREPWLRGLPTAAAPLAGNALAAHTLSLPRRRRMPAGGTCQAHRCAGGCLLSTRITRNEVAAMNRPMRVPAAQ